MFLVNLKNLFLNIYISQPYMYIVQILISGFKILKCVVKNNIKYEISDMLYNVFSGASPTYLWQTLSSRIPGMSWNWSQVPTFFSLFNMGYSNTLFLLNTFPTPCPNGHIHSSIFLRIFFLDTFAHKTTKMYLGNCCI
jgi:hypothetical protein